MQGIGIAILGLNGSGKSTLAHALAEQINYFEMDVEDYYFPEQKASRRQALENHRIMHTSDLGDLPFSNPRTRQEVQDVISKDIKTHPQFIISGVTMNWSDEILSYIDIAFLIQTPLEERLRRIQAREEKRFGMRVLAGGDMYTQQINFRNVVKNRDPKSVEESAKKLGCSVIIMDGTRPVAENLERIIDHLNRIS